MRYQWVVGCETKLTRIVDREFHRVRVNITINLKPSRAFWQSDCEFHASCLLKWSCHLNFIVTLIHLDRASNLNIKKLIVTNITTNHNVFLEIINRELSYLIVGVPAEFTLYRVSVFVVSHVDGSDWSILHPWSVNGEFTFIFSHSTADLMHLWLLSVLHHEVTHVICSPLRLASDSVCTSWDHNCECEVTVEHGSVFLVVLSRDRNLKLKIFGSCSYLVARINKDS